MTVLKKLSNFFSFLLYFCHDAGYEPETTKAPLKELDSLDSVAQNTIILSSQNSVVSVNWFIKSYIVVMFQCSSIFRKT